ncbi:hypothetical protein SY88_13300 [Clostridiales bacterium PH28_bin88]|nr:hypothetical protein SY88_13300 [Clostridiales bacterium PH28_bin88]
MDIGGTFTDFVLYDELTGEYRTGKVSTTPKDLSIGVLEGLGHLAKDLSDIDFCVHGTTAGLNSFLERKGARVALITTEGFRDVYEIARGNRPEMYNLQYRKPEPLVKRRDIFELKERVLFDGTVAAAEDMNASLFRSAFSPVIYEMKDCSVGIFNDKAKMLGQSAGLPIFLGNLEECIKKTIDMYGLDFFQEGDVLIMNDAYMTGTHLNDVTVFA